MESEEGETSNNACIENNTIKIQKEKTFNDTSINKENIDIESKACLDVKNDKILTLVAEEKEEQIFIYDRNENGIEQTENTSHVIEVCDSNTAVEITNDSQEKSNIVPVIINEDKDENPDGFTYSEIVEVDENIIQGENVEEIKVIETINNADEKTVDNEEENQSKNYRNVILEDWEVEVPQVTGNNEICGFTESVTTCNSQTSEVLDAQKVNYSNSDNSTVVQIIKEVELTKGENKECVSVHNENENSGTTLEGEILKIMSDTKTDSLKYTKSISKNDLVKILDENSERLVKPIVTGKDLFFSIELTKRLNQKLTQNKSLKNLDSGEKSNHSENESINNNNSLDDRQKIVDILEADEIKDWKSTPSKPEAKENGNDMEITKAIKNMEENISTGQASVKLPKKTVLKKFRTMDKELERSIALQQLREEFPTTRKRTRTLKKVNHIPFLASTVLEKAMTSPEVTTALKPGPPKRRPCYLPDNNPVENNDGKIKRSKVNNNFNEDDNIITNSKTGNNSHVSATDLNVGDIENTSIANAVVKTYTVKRKSTDAENDIKSTLQTIAAVRKALSENTDETSEIKPKKQKISTKSDDKIRTKIIKKKTNLKGGTGKRNLELEKLLSDEGAVRMLYETQHNESNTSPKKSKIKSTTNLKKDLVLKTKLVKNAVMRLSGVGTEGVYLRKKRFSKVITTPEIKAEPLFASTPNVVLYQTKPKKKQRAEASRILYRHSSSESFASSEGDYRKSIDEDLTLNDTNKEECSFAPEKLEEINSTDINETEKAAIKTKIKKSEIFSGRKLIKVRGSKLLRRKKEVKVMKVSKTRKKSENLNADSPSDSKLSLSIVPVRKSSRPRKVSKKYSIWSSTSMDSLSVESLGLKKLKKASPELGKKLNCSELTILQYEYLVQVILNSSSTQLKNSLNLEVLQELKQVFSFLSEEDSCKAVLLSSIGTVFCQGIDINQIISWSESERRIKASQLADAVRDFCACLADFEKPVIAGVQGVAIGLGVALLPYCDIVVASDSASFYTPYVKLGQASEGAASYTFPRINRHLVSELLFQSHKMTVADAYKHGLVSRIIPEERFSEELLVLARHMAAQSIQGIRSIKLLLKNNNHEGILETLKLECEMLEGHWTTTECLNNMIKFFNSGVLQLKSLECA